MPEKAQLLTTINEICLVYLKSKLSKDDFRLAIEGNWQDKEYLTPPYIYFENIHAPEAKDAGYFIDKKAVFNYLHQYPELTDEVFGYELRALARSYCVPSSVWHCLGFTYFSFDFLFSSRVNEFSKPLGFPPDYQYLTDKQFPSYGSLQLPDIQLPGVILGKEHDQLVFMFFEAYEGQAPEWLPTTGNELYIDDPKQNTITLFEKDLLLVPEEAIIIPDAFFENVENISEESITSHFLYLFLTSAPHKVNITTDDGSVISVKSFKQTGDDQLNDEIKRYNDEPTIEGFFVVVIITIYMAVSAYLFETYVL